MRANTENVQQGEQETRGVGEGWGKKCGTETLGDLWKGAGCGRGTQGKQGGHYRDFQVLTRQGLSGRKAGNLKEVGLWKISRGRKDRGFGWGKIRDGGEHLF